MTDENKTYKSKTIELFGKEFEVSHKASKAINNKFLVLLGIIKYYLTKTLQPIKNCFVRITNWDFFEPFIFIFGIVLFLILFFSFIGTFAEYFTKPKFCRKGCDIYENYCVGYHGRIEECIENNTYFLQELLKTFISITNGTFIIIYYLVIFGIIIGLVINILYGIANLLIYLFNKVYKQVETFNEQIPDIEEI